MDGKDNTQRQAHLKKEDFPALRFKRKGIREKKQR